MAAAVGEELLNRLCIIPRVGYRGKGTKQGTKSLLQSQNLQLLSSLSSILESVNPTLQTCESVCEEKCI